jgi:hypothetical protein
MFLLVYETQITSIDHVFLVLDRERVHGWGHRLAGYRRFCMAPRHHLGRALQHLPQVLQLQHGNPVSGVRGSLG